jgi:Leucine-rich repeat (LRR) protein
MKYFNVVIFALIIINIQDFYSQEIKFKDESLKSTLIEMGYDYSKNGEIEISEIDTILNLNISKRNIKQLDDLLHFKKLKILNAMTNQISDLDVFSDNATIEDIYIGDNRLGKRLKLKGLKNLKGLYAFRNGLEEIDLTGTENIQSLYLQGNFFKTLDFKNLPKLRSLQLSECEKLEELSIANNPALAQLYITYTAVSTLDITKNPLLKTLYVEKNVEIIRTNNQSDFKPTPDFKTPK